jgi:hypothetical protein
MLLEAFKEQKNLCLQRIDTGNEGCNWERHQKLIENAGRESPIVMFPFAERISAARVVVTASALCNIDDDNNN